MNQPRLTVSEETSGVRQPGIWELVFPDATITFLPGGKAKVDTNSGTSISVIEVQKTVGFNPLGGHRAVKLIGGLLEYADHSDIHEAEVVLGITTQAGNPGDTINVVLSGEIQESSWSWTQGLPIYLSTNGQLTQTAPTTFSTTELGIALTSDTILVRIQETLFY